MRLSTPKALYKDSIPPTLSPLESTRRQTRSSEKKNNKIKQGKKGDNEKKKGEKEKEKGKGERRKEAEKEKEKKRQQRSRSLEFLFHSPRTFTATTTSIIKHVIPQLQLPRWTVSTATARIRVSSICSSTVSQISGSTYISTMYWTFKSYC